MSRAALASGLCVAALGAAVAALGGARTRAVALARVHPGPDRAVGWPGWLPPGWAVGLTSVGMAPTAPGAAAALVVGGLVVVAAARAGGAPGLVVAAAALGAAGPLAAARTRRREAAEHAAGLPLALEDMARALRGGRSLRQAVTEAGRRRAGALGAELGQVARLAADGVPMAEAVGWWRRVRPEREVRLTCAALVLCASAGGEPARALDGVAATIRAEQALAGEVRAQSAQARLSAGCITLAPLVFTGLTCLGDPATADFLFRTRAGWACLAVGLSLDVVAALWMRRILAARP